MNFVVFAVCAGIGYLLGRFIPDPTWAAFVSILVSYHLFLGWLLLTAEHEVGFSLPVGHTIMTHLACLTVVVLLGVGRHYIPLFGIIRYFIPAMAPFERDWLFNADDVKKKPAPVPTVAAADVPEIEATQDDYDAWVKHLATRHFSTIKRGTSVKEQYQEFIAERHRNRPASTSTNPPANSDTTATGAPHS
jgi:hypothetical protein